MIRIVALVLTLAGLVYMLWRFFYDWHLESERNWRRLEAVFGDEQLYGLTKDEARFAAVVGLIKPLPDWQERLEKA